jgi:hypothetical protein
MRVVVGDRGDGAIPSAVAMDEVNRKPAHSSQPVSDSSRRRVEIILRTFGGAANRGLIGINGSDTRP